MICAPSEDSDQHEHAQSDQSLDERSVDSHNDPKFLQDSVDSDQIVEMHADLVICLSKYMFSRDRVHIQTCQAIYFLAIGFTFRSVRRYISSR